MVAFQYRCIKSLKCCIGSFFVSLGQLSQTSGITPIEDNAFPIEDGVFPTEDKSFPYYNDLFPTEDKSFPYYNDPFPTEDKSFPYYNDLFPTENRSFLGLFNKLCQKEYLIGEENHIDTLEKHKLYITAHHFLPFSILAKTPTNKEVVNLYKKTQTICC